MDAEAGGAARPLRRPRALSASAPLACAATLLLATALPGQDPLPRPDSAPPAPLADSAPTRQTPPVIDHMQVLPPVLPWDGASRALLAAPDDPWITPAEASGFTASPSYAATRDWLERLVAAAPELRLTSIGTTPEGREILLVIASAEGAATPGELLLNGKPTVFAQAAIHAGEVDGKDAGLMLLRDMTARGTARGLLDVANFLFIPILNADGHERTSRHNRMNQRGPEETGWRATARNLNLNRDYAKLDAPETRAVVAALRDWRPDLYVDLHVTDGVDFQYDITYGYNVAGWSPAITGWLDEALAPALARDLSAAGHVPGPLFFATDGRDPANGIVGFSASPRFSNGYGDASHLPSLLVENHALKPFEQRVLGTRVLLESVLRAVAAGQVELREAMAADRARRPAGIPLAFDDLGVIAALSGEEQAAPEQAAPAPVDAAAEAAGTAAPVPDSAVVPDTLPLPAPEPAPLGRPAAPPPGLDDAAGTEPFTLLAVEARREHSPITGAERVVWTGRPVTLQVPLSVPDRPLHVVTRPAAYWIPPAWSEVIERLEAHGIALERQAEAREVDVEMYRLLDARVQPTPIEGRVRVTASPAPERRTETFPPGSVRVPTDQPLGTLAMLLLEPDSPDSFFQWGFFLEVLSRTEYAEEYVMEPLARRMLEADPLLRAEFDRRLAQDPAFAADPAARLAWFYQRSPYADERHLLYPVAREAGF